MLHICFFCFSLQKHVSPNKIIAQKRAYYAKMYYLCAANTSYWLTQIINPLKNN